MMKLIRLFKVGFRLARIREESFLSSLVSAVVSVARYRGRPVDDLDKSFGD